MVLISSLCFRKQLDIWLNLHDEVLRAKDPQNKAVICNSDNKFKGKELESGNSSTAGPLSDKWSEELFW